MFGTISSPRPTAQLLRRSPVASSTPAPLTGLSKEAKWFLGLGGTWIILTLMVDLGDTSDLAVALALVIMSSVVLTYGADAFKNLGLVPPTTPTTTGG